MKLFGGVDQLPPVVTLVNEIEVGMHPDIKLTHTQRHLLTNEGKWGRAEAVLHKPLPAPVSIALAADPERVVRRCFVSDAPTDKYYRSFNECYPPGLMEVLWPSLSNKRKRMVLQARAESLRGELNVSRVYRLWDVREVVDMVSVLSWDVTESDWRLYDLMRNDNPSIDDFAEAMLAGDPEVRLAIANHPKVPPVVLEALVHDANPLIRDAVEAALQKQTLSIAM